ncbi:MAG: ribosome maturation factor RimP [Clostridia bacterium]|nr:ribosome maturation factor RimP [Clostridia bacterium]
MKKDSNTVASVKELVLPYAQQLGLDIWDIKYLKEGKDWFLRIFIDKPGGITIEDCENLSRAIDAPLDDLTVFKNSYCLEVSSPGVERKLEKKHHFQKFIGSPVNVKLVRSLNNKKTFSGVLTNYDQDDITVTEDDGNILNFNMSDVSFVKLDDFRGDF